MLLDASPSDLADGQMGIEVLVEFVLSTLFAFLGLATTALLLRRLGSA
jgi:hypothetical protein